MVGYEAAGTKAALRGASLAGRCREEAELGGAVGGPGSVVSAVFSDAEPGGVGADVEDCCVLGVGRAAGRELERLLLAPSASARQCVWAFLRSSTSSTAR